MGRVLASVTAAALLAAGGYVAADIYDLVPGVLTRQHRVAPTPAPSLGSTPSPGEGALPVAASPTPVPTPAGAPPSRAGLAAGLTPLLTDPALGTAAVVVRDGITGRDLFSHNAERAMTPASTSKLLSAAAITSTLDMRATMTTRVVSGPRPGDIVLVAGGDTMLGPGRGNPGKVEGHAGLADLADQAAARLTAAKIGVVRLRLDLSYATGPRYPSRWKMVDVDLGFTQGVAMVGLAGQRPKPGFPSPAKPEVKVAERFAALLTARGHRATLLPESTWQQPAPARAAALGAVESAPYSDVLDLALLYSDNALTENLARQALVSTGGRVPADGSVGTFVRSRLDALGIDTRGMNTVDASGLSAGQSLRPRMLADVLLRASRNTPPGMQQHLASLPVGGVTGTMDIRFTGKGTRDVAGIPRAKTGSLHAVSALAGTTVDADGYPLLFVTIANGIPDSQGTSRARAALDRVVAAITRCGCR